MDIKRNKMDPSIYNRLIAEAKKDDVQRYVVGAIISSGNRVLLLHRKQDDFMGGIDEIPSGRVEEHETLEDALKREIKEETGLRVKDITDYLGHFDYHSKKGVKTRQFNFVVITNNAKVILSEHDAYSLVTKEQVDRSNATQEVKETIKAYFGKHR